MPADWEIKAYTVDRRAEPERNKSCRTKIPEEVTVGGMDPLPAARRLVSVLEGMAPSERTEFCRFDLRGPDPQARVQAAEQDPAGEPGGLQDPSRDGGDEHE